MQSYRLSKWKVVVWLMQTFDLYKQKTTKASEEIEFKS